MTQRGREFRADADDCVSSEPQQILAPSLLLLSPGARV
jgi:hypothetical protein